MPDSDRDKFLDDWYERIDRDACDPCSELAIKLLYDASEAYRSGLDIAALITAVATIETLLRIQNPGAHSFAKLIEFSEFTAAEKSELNRLRKYRNKWVHVNQPMENDYCFDDEKAHGERISEMTKIAISMTFKVVYSFPGAV